MTDYTKKLGKVIEINEAQIHDHLGELVKNPHSLRPCIPKLNYILTGSSTKCIHY